MFDSFLESQFSVRRGNIVCFLLFSVLTRHKFGESVPTGATSALLGALRCGTFWRKCGSQTMRK
jgi:hypothetical protein